jgi:hypothetical protein
MITSEELTEIDRVMGQWVDQFNQNLLLTVQAVQALQEALDKRFTHRE